MHRDPSGTRPRSTPPGFAVRTAGSSGKEAYELLLTEIKDGELAPGTRLREAELAGRFGLSRTPIREALKRAELQGLVAHEPHWTTARSPSFT